MTRALGEPEPAPTEPPRPAQRLRSIALDSQSAVANETRRTQNQSNHILTKTFFLPLRARPLRLSESLRTQTWSLRNQCTRLGVLGSVLSIFEVRLFRLFRRLAIVSVVTVRTAVIPRRCFTAQIMKHETRCFTASAAE